MAAAETRPGPLCASMSLRSASSSSSAPASKRNSPAAKPPAGAFTDTAALLHYCKECTKTIVSELWRLPLALSVRIWICHNIRSNSSSTRLRDGVSCAVCSPSCSRSCTGRHSLPSSCQRNSKPSGQRGTRHSSSWTPPWSECQQSLCSQGLKQLACS